MEAFLRQVTAVFPALTIALVGVTGAGAASNAVPDPPQNIVLILADDLGWSDLGCYGSDLHETPNIDRLAEQGVRFTCAYTASCVCTPTRASILTGRHPARLKMTKWREGAANRGTRRLLEPVVLDSLPREELTLAELLHDGGYFAVHVGKWHLGPAESYPEAHGFDANVGGSLWGAPPSFFYPFRGDKCFREWRYVPGLEPGRDGDYLTDRLTDRAIEWIDRLANRPFFLNVWYYAVHTPIEGKAELVKKYEAKATPGARHTNADYAAMVESLDENVGRILAKLDEAGIADRTAVVFFSDNGGCVIPYARLSGGRPPTNNAPLRSGKGSLYEGGIRVPLIVRSPGVSPAGTTCDEPIYSCDLFPTLLGLAGISPNTVKGVPLDGADLGGLLRNPSAPLDPRPLFFHYPHYHFREAMTPASAMRDGQWKLLEYFEDRRLELYDLTEDPAEEHDLSGEKPLVAKELRRRLHAWRQRVDAPVPTPNPD